MRGGSSRPGTTPRRRLGTPVAGRRWRAAGGGRARVLHRSCGTRGSRPGGVWMAEYVATMAPASSTGGHAAAEQFQHDPGASRSASATIPGARSSPSRASPGGWGYVRALNKAYSLRRGENEDGHARSASGRPPDRSGETREWCARQARPWPSGQPLAASELVHRIVHRPPLSLHHLIRSCDVVCRSPQSRWRPCSTPAVSTRRPPRLTARPNSASCRRFGGRGLVGRLLAAER